MPAAGQRVRKVVFHLQPKRIPTSRGTGPNRETRSGKCETRSNSPPARFAVMSGREAHLTAWAGSELVNFFPMLIENGEEFHGKFRFPPVPCEAGRHI